jgi:hypothetical protein
MLMEGSRSGFWQIIKDPGPGCPKTGSKNTGIFNSIQYHNLCMIRMLNYLLVNPEYHYIFKQLLSQCYIMITVFYVF